jgi:hypothetical protein
MVLVFSQGIRAFVGACPRVRYRSELRKIGLTSRISEESSRDNLLLVVFCSSLD